ncbi:unnamed protein product [Rotaria sp. Silwood2]|nr:unnamed protein product [Rotaria sp. Silwood2]CAF3081727.1 unnamed protein product [Rotaria sp. Silwood2]CAF4407805.1 unnamed protein product [Rotaria sp. Silwood2]CAF4497370.1 unnamed protein product [Rotaria sp. Silwood2]
MSAKDEDLSRLIEDAKVKFNQYAGTQKDFQSPQAYIHIETESDETTKVHMDVQYNGTQYYFESIQEKDINDIYHYLNSQPTEGYEVNGHPLKAVVATARMDNEGPWKSNTKAGMTLYAVHVSSNYVSNLRYELRKNM